MSAPRRNGRGSMAAGPGRPARTKRKAGFSLLEMLVASAVLAVGLVIVTESISSGLTVSTGVDRELFARQLAADRLNRAAAGEYAPLPRAGRVSSGGVQYYWRVQAGGQQRGLRSALCVIRWTTRGRRQTVTLSRQLPPSQEGGQRP